MRAVGIIPARWQSQRFPGKPLAPIAGRPMIQWVFEGARQAKRLRRVLIATDDRRIARACRAFGAEAVLTSPHHASGTDRIAEVAASLDDDIVVNIQGDEPLISGHVIDAAVWALEEEAEVGMSTVAHAAEVRDLDDRNRVKVAIDQRGRALTFSRTRIPPLPGSGDPPVHWQHVGLYAYRRTFLLDFAKLPPTSGERSEALEQLRVLENGHPICVALIKGWRSFSVDVPEDVARVEAELARRDEENPG